MRTPISDSAFQILSKVLTRDETILWSGTPRLVPFLLRGLGSWVVTTALFMGVLAATDHFSVTTIKEHGMFWTILWFSSIYGVVLFIGRALAYRRTIYAFTNARVIIHTGSFGASFNTMDRAKISEVKVTVSVIERLSGVGTVSFLSGVERNEDGAKKVYESWFAIEQPYEVLKYVREASTEPNRNTA